jgi:hypothetical protein
MVRRSVLVVVVTSAACIKLAEFHPLDAGSDAQTADAASPDAAPPGVCGNGGSGMATASMSGTSICAAGPGYALRFPARGFRYPDELRIGSAEVLGTSTACNEEGEIGMAAYPMPRFAADTPATGETGSASILLPGPVVAKVEVTWSWHAAAACVPSGSAVSGISTFTLFPDGRLVRFDQLTTPTSADKAMCDCGSAAQGFFITAYLALDQSTSPVITDQGGSAYAPGTAYGTTTPPLLCASGSDWGIGIAQLAQGRARLTTGGAISLTYDFSATGDSTLHAGTQSTVTAYQIGSAACTAAQLAPIDQFTMSTGPNLQIHRGGTSPFDDVIGTSNDGMYGGDYGSPPGGPGGLPVGAGTVVLTAKPGDTIPGGWALWVGGGVTLHNPTANPPRTGAWYQIQNGTSDGIIWVRDALSGSDTITVTAQ